MTAEELFLQLVRAHEGPSLDFKASHYEKEQRYAFIEDILDESIALLLLVVRGLEVEAGPLVRAHQLQKQLLSRHCRSPRTEFLPQRRPDTRDQPASTDSITTGQSMDRFWLKLDKKRPALPRKCRRPIKACRRTTSSPDAT